MTFRIPDWILESRVNHAAEPRCRQQRMAQGLPYPRSNCEECGSIIRPGWRCPRASVMGAIGPEILEKTAALIDALVRYLLLYRHVPETLHVGNAQSPAQLAALTLFNDIMAHSERPVHANYDYPPPMEVANLAHMHDEQGPDARQSEDPNLKPSRFRPRYRQLTQVELVLNDAIKGKAAELEALFDQAPKGREQSIAMTKLEEAIMWIVKGITA